MLPQASPELPSEYCSEADYANRATFTGFEERVANASIVLGAQFIPPVGVSFPTAMEAFEEAEHASDTSGLIDTIVERLRACLTGMRLRLGYWPTAHFKDPTAHAIDWQARFETSSSDKLGFATFVHCLLDGAAEYNWLNARECGEPTR